MNKLIKGIITTALTLATTSLIAAPAYLITHNKTNVESNAYVAGKAGPHPTPAYSDGKVAWMVVRMACYGKIDPQGRCTAVVKMATNTSNPVVLGTVSMNVETGDILPKKVSGNGYTLTVNGPGETTLTKD